MRRLFSAFLQNELTPHHRQWVEEHLLGCKGCQEEIHLLQVALSSLQYLEWVPVPPGLRDSVHRQIVGQVQTTKHHSLGKWLKGLAGTAIGAILLGVGIGGWWWSSGKIWNQNPENSLRMVTQPRKPLTTSGEDTSSSPRMSREIAGNPLNLKGESAQESRTSFTPYHPTQTRPAGTGLLPQRVSPARNSSRISYPVKPDSAEPTVFESIGPLDSMLRYAAQGRASNQALALPQEGISPERPRGFPQTESSIEGTEPDKEVPFAVDHETGTADHETEEEEEKEPE